MNHTEPLTFQPEIKGFTDGDTLAAAEMRTARARRAAITRRARLYVQRYLAESAEYSPKAPAIVAVEVDDEIAFGRTDCEFLFRD